MDIQKGPLRVSREGGRAPRRMKAEGAQSLPQAADVWLSHFPRHIRQAMPSVLKELRGHRGAGMSKHSSSFLTSVIRKGFMGEGKCVMDSTTAAV